MNRLEEPDKGLIICGFPGVGKTFLAEQCNIVDSDSSKFKANHEGYIKHLKELYDQDKVVLSSTHEDVIVSLLELDINILLVYPDISLKFEYIVRYIDRGNDIEFVKLLRDNWENWIKAMAEYECPQIVLKPYEYLNDVIGIGWRF